MIVRFTFYSGFYSVNPKCDYFNSYIWQCRAKLLMMFVSWRCRNLCGARLSASSWHLVKA